MPYRLLKTRNLLMTKTQTLFFSLIAMLFILSGCAQNNSGLPRQSFNPFGGFGSSSPQGEGNAWADQSNIGDEENIDISDLDENLTESELSLSEETAAEQKMKRIPFPSAEYNRLARTGKGTIKGTIYINNAFQQKVFGAGTRLYLNPVTSYSNQWFKESYLGGQKMEKADSRLFNYLKFTASDSKGNFAFYGVPSGSYYLIGTVKCGTECGYDTPKNIRIATKVSVYGNNVVQQDLNRFVD